MQYGGKNFKSESNTKYQKQFGHGFFKKTSNNNNKKKRFSWPTDPNIFGHFTGNTLFCIACKA